MEVGQCGVTSRVLEGPRIALGRTRDRLQLDVIHEALGS
jgi:hypothetical protein